MVEQVHHILEELEAAAQYLEVLNGTNTGGNGSSKGGAGGNAKPDKAVQVGSGAGNPAGTANTNKGENGTGGLLIIYGNELTNNGTLDAQGSNGGYSSGTSGGSSGGGSINIYYGTSCTKGKCLVSGGTVKGFGGAGTAAPPVQID